MIARGLQVEKNILLTASVVALGVGVGHSVAAAGGLLVGGILAIINYRWLHSGVQTMLTLAANNGESPSVWRAGAKFFLRWVLIFLALAVCQLYTVTLTIAVVAGLLISAIPIVVTNGSLGTSESAPISEP